MSIIDEKARADRLAYALERVLDIRNEGWCLMCVDDRCNCESRRHRAADAAAVRENAKAALEEHRKARST